MSIQSDFLAKKEELTAKRLAVADLYKQAEAATDDTKRADIYDSVKTANTELAALVDAIEPIAELVAAQEQNAAALKALRQPAGTPTDGDSEDVSRSKTPSLDI